MKDQIKSLLIEKSEKRSVKDVLFRMWDSGVELGDRSVLQALGYSTNMIASERREVQELIKEYLGKKIGTQDEEKILSYWKKLIEDKMPKTFLIDDGHYYIKFKIDSMDFYEDEFFTIKVLDFVISISDASYYMHDDEKVYLKDMEGDSIEEEHLAIEIEGEIFHELQKYTEPFNVGVSDVEINGIVSDKKMLREQEEGEDEPEKDLFDEYIEGINNGDEELIDEISSTFDGLDIFFRLMIRKHKFGEIDFFSRDLVNCNSYNKVLHGLALLDIPESLKIIENAAGFADIVEENGVYYWWSEREDWAEIFRDSRNGMSKKLIEKMLSGNFDSWEYWESYNHNPYEVYSELTSENAYLVNMAIKKALLGKTMFVDEDEYDVSHVIVKLLKMQKSENTITLSNFALDSLLNDDFCIKLMFKNNSLSDDLEEVLLDLQRAYSNAEENVYWSQCYEEIYNKIVSSGYADNFKSGNWQVKPNRRGDQYKFEITKNLKEVLYSWLNEYKNYSDDIAYQGNYINFIQQLEDFGYETVWPPDHASYHQTIKELNKSFITDYF